MTAVRRPLNWYGSKERLCPVIHGLVPPGPDTWVDAFCGSAIVTLRKPRHRREVINDLDGEVVNLFEVLRSGRAEALCARLELTPYAETLLYDARAQAVPGDPVERAARFLVLSWFGRGGRVAHKSGFRWSKGATTSPERLWAALPQRLAAVVDRLRGVCVRRVEALQLIDEYDHPDCVLFLDPPYPGDVGRHYAVRMTADDHAALAERLRACRAHVILTMNPGTVYGRVLGDWTETRVSVLGGGASVKGEVILTNYEPLPLLGMAAPTRESA